MEAKKTVYDKVMAEWSNMEAMEMQNTRMKDLDDVIAYTYWKRKTTDGEFNK